MAISSAGKPAIKSKTIILNAGAVAIWLIGLIVESAEMGTLPDEWTEYAALIIAVGNMILRSYTTEPISGIVSGGGGDDTDSGDDDPSAPTMRIYSAALLAMLIPVSAMAAGPLAIITGPSGGVPGDEIILDASGSTGEVFRWECVRRGHSPNDTHYQVSQDGRSLQIHSYPGVYDVTLMVADADGIDWKRKTVTVWASYPPDPLPDPDPVPPSPPGPQPPSPPGPTPPTPPQPEPEPEPEPEPLPDGEFSISRPVYETASRINSPTLARDAHAIASAMETVAAAVSAGTLRTTGEIVEALRERINTILRGNVSPWQEFNEMLARRLKQFSDAGRLENNSQWATLLIEIATGLKQVGA